MGCHLEGCHSGVYRSEVLQWEEKDRQQEALPLVVQLWVDRLLVDMPEAQTDEDSCDDVCG